MARELRTFHVTVPAGTLPASPATFNVEFPERELRELQILIPPGPRGMVGFQIAQAGGQVFPSEPGAFFVTDDEKIIWPIEHANTSGAWQVIAYNLGQYPHTIEVRFLVDLPGGQELAATGGETSGPLDPAQLIPQAPAPPAPAELPGGTLPEPPNSPPPGVPVAPIPPGVSGPQAPELPSLANEPAPPGLPPLVSPGSAVAAFDAGEANTQALLQGAAAQANLEALLNELEARDQILHQNALGELPVSPTPKDHAIILI